MDTERPRDAGADGEEVRAFYTQVLRGEADAEGRSPTLAERLKAADSLYKAISARAGEEESLKRLDALLKEIRDAADRETT